MLKKKISLTFFFLLNKISLTFWLKNLAYDIGPEVLNFYNCEAQVDLFGPLQYHKPIFF